jgi:hypothetical protein
MPIKQLHIVKKIKFLVANGIRSNRIRSKKQIVDEVEENAKEHRILNQRQEKEDDARVDHAVKELQKENEVRDDAYVRILRVLVISILINFLLLATFGLFWYFIFYK